LEYLYFERIQSDGYFTAAASVSMGSLAIFLSIVMLKRVNETEEIVEHEDPTGGSLPASPYVRHACPTLVSRQDLSGLGPTASVQHLAIFEIHPKAVGLRGRDNKHHQQAHREKK